MRGRAGRRAAWPVILFSALHAKYLKCELLYAEDQRQDVNPQEQTPSLNYQASAVLSRVLAGSLENNLVRENQMLNGRLEDDLMQDAKTNTALDLLQNPTYAIDLCLRRKLSTEVSLTRDVRLRGNGVNGGATVAAAGGADDAAAAGGVAEKEVHSIQQAHRILERANEGGEQKAGDMTPSDAAFSKSVGSHHRFSRNKLSENPIDVNQVSRDAFAAAGYATTGTAASSNKAMILRTRKRATEKMVDLAVTPRTKRKVMVVRTALSGRNEAYVSIIDDIAGPGVFSQDLLAYCMEQAAQEMKEKWFSSRLYKLNIIFITILLLPLWRLSGRCRCLCPRLPPLLLTNDIRSGGTWSQKVQFSWQEP